MSEKAVEMLTKLRLLNKRLQKQSKKMKAESEKCRDKARDYVTRGEDEAAKEFLLQSMNYKKWAEGVDKFQIKIESLSMRLQQSRLVADFGDITKELATSLTGLSNNVSAPEIQKYMERRNVLAHELSRIDNINTDTILKYLRELILKTFGSKVKEINLYLYKKINEKIIQSL